MKRFCTSLFIVLTFSNMPFFARAELTLPLTIKNQGNSGYCSYYAMTNFLEILHQQQSGYYGGPLHPGFLAFSSNLLTKAGDGQRLDWMWLTTILYGVLPEGAVHQDFRFKQPLRQWHAYNADLLDPVFLSIMLESEFTPPKEDFSINPRDYLRSLVGDSLREYQVIVAKEVEPTRAPSPTLGSRNLRYISLEETNRVLYAKASHMGYQLFGGEQTSRDLLTSIHQQIRSELPVYIGFMPNLGEKSFRSYSILSHRSLVKPGYGQPGLHFAVATHICRQERGSEVPVGSVCKRFEEGMLKTNVKQCTIIVNTWGKRAHGIGKGLVCVDDMSLRRMLTEAMIHENFLR